MSELRPAIGTLAFQRAMSQQDGDLAFTSHFGDRLPVRGLRTAGPMRPDELDSRSEVVADGRARVLDSWNPADMKLLDRVIDMAAKGVYRILVHTPYPAAQQDPGKPPRICVYLVWHELAREIREVNPAVTAPSTAYPGVPGPGSSAPPLGIVFPESSSAHEIPAAPV